ncbi:MAG: hypothetical protein KJZ93_32285 [Caldilineaceae bacterium]|nr:hypothetical protein [Caldilineaceae bacterium]
MNRQADTERTNSDFSGFTAPANAPGQDASRAGKASLDAWLEGQEESPPWRTLYEDLLVETVIVEDSDGKTRRRPRWDWRRALYIAWRCVPPALREPKTEQELASLLGLTNTRTIRAWREKDPEIEERIAKLPKTLLMDHVSAVMVALVTVASEADAKAHPDRKLFLEMTGHYKPRSVQEIAGEGGGPVQVVTGDELAIARRRAQQTEAKLLGDESARQD